MPKCGMASQMASLRGACAHGPHGAEFRHHVRLYDSRRRPATCTAALCIGQYAAQGFGSAMDNSRDHSVRPSMLGRRASSVSSRFPVPADFFPTVTFSPDQHAFLKEQADKLASEATQNAKWAMSYEDGTNGWKLSNSQRHFRETGIRTYCRRRDARDRNGQRQLEFRCMGKVQMSVEHCLNALYSDNTTDFRSNSTFLIEHALDAVVLNALETRTDDNPHHYLGLNWLASRSPGLFSKSRDLCYLRSTGTIMDSNKAKVGYVVIQSVDLKECVSMENSLGLIRDKMSAVMIFKENAENRATNVLWQGSMGVSGHSSSKLVNFVHETFTSAVSNLNKVQEAKYMAQQVEGHKFQRMIAGEQRKHCYICNKKFSLVRTRSQCSACGEHMCKDCEVSSRAKAFNSDSFDVPTPTSSRPEFVLFCKNCVTDARRAMSNKTEGGSARTNPSFLLFDNSLYPPSADEADHRPSNAGKTSNQSSSTSTSSLQKLAANSSGGPAANKSKVPERTPLYVGTTIHMSSAGEVPISPLSIRTQREKRRSRLETDPMESYDGFDNREYGVPLETDEYDPSRESSSSFSSYKYTSSNHRGSQEARDNDMANRLREISQRAQEALEVTKRNSCMMSDTSSAPRVSDLSAFKDLDKSIAEQADLLNVIGFVSTGRVYMENNGPEQGGVRVSESSSVMSEDERFEVVA